MTLDEYLTGCERGAARRMARSLGVSEVTLYRWRHGRQMPTHEMIRAIEVETCGGVCPQDWYPSQEATE